MTNNPDSNTHISDLTTHSLELRNQILLMQENKMEKDMKTLVDLGNHCYVQAVM